MTKMSKLEKLSAKLLAVRVERKLLDKEYSLLERAALAAPDCFFASDIIAVSADNAKAANDMSRIGAQLRELLEKELELERAVGAEIAARADHSSGNAFAVIFDGSVSVSCLLSKPIGGKKGKVSRQVVHGTVEFHVRDPRAFVSFVLGSVMPKMVDGSEIIALVLLKEVIQ